MDEYDYIDIAVDTLRNIKHFGATEYVSYITVDPSGKAHLPCNIDTIDAVTTQEMGRKAYATRVDFEMDGILNTDTYYTMEGIMTSLGRGGRLDLQVLQAGYISPAGRKHISVGKHMQAIKLLWLLQGLPRFRRASIIRQMPQAAVTASACCKRCQQRTKAFLLW
jgi:hypothetical protein